MRDIKLHYGAGFINLRIPETNVAVFLRPGQSDDALETVGWKRILESESFLRFHHEIKDRYLCVLLGDGTRDLPLEHVLLHILPRLTTCRQVLFLVCTGTHNADTKANQHIIEQLESLISQACLSDCNIVVHDCATAHFINAGRTPQQTPVLYNSVIQDADLFLVLSDVKPHYFAGYSNPVKNFVPGLCAYSTTEKNHSLA
ncbi:MAG: DUF2088 domain-containing protein, partial [Sedimentisphaerales bacterium]|nr:DUF2088 domain-containing protein [Sedimentisphaerales bacterium]